MVNNAGPIATDGDALGYWKGSKVGEERRKKMERG